MDLYRLDTIEEIIDLGLDEYLYGDGVCVVEWAEKAAEVFPEQHVLVRLDYIDETSRRLTLTGSGVRHDKLFNALKAALTEE